MNVERLTRLAEVLEAQKFAVAAGFNLNEWFINPVDEDGDEVPSIKLLDEEVETINCGPRHEVDATKVDCGSAACACGHAALMPEFQAEGFRLVADDDGYVEPFFNGEIAWSAVQRFFGLIYSEASYLFNSSKYDGVGDGRVPPAHVAKRIRQMVKSYQDALAKEQA